MSMTIIPVVCAVIEHEVLVLLAQRATGKYLSLKWEFPGGKIEPNETPEAALVREIREELGCTVEHLQFISRTTHHYEHASVDMTAYRCRLASTSPAPKALEHLALAWCQLAELLDYDLAPADLPVVEVLKAVVSLASG